MAGCGEDEPAGDPAADEAETTAELEIVLDPDGPGGEPTRTAKVVCQRIGGAGFCPDLEGISAEDFAPVPADVACTEIYGGPDTVEIAGTLRGEPVEATLTRANGCEIDRFDRFTALLRAKFPGYEPGASLAPPDG